MMSSDWCDMPPDWQKHSLTLLETDNSQLNKRTSLHEVIANSASHPIKLPTETNRCQYLKTKFPETVLEDNINSAYPILHEKALRLCAAFLAHKRMRGSRIEKQIYDRLSLLDLIDRLLQKRAIVFVGARDLYMLRDGTTGLGNWDTIGTPDEKPPLILKDYLSYDEIKLAALLAISSFTVYVNDGNRNNCGHFENSREKIEDRGVIMGLVGTRMVPGVMEYQEIVKSEKQNTERNGYGSNAEATSRGVFAKFYGDTCETYNELQKTKQLDSDRYIKLLDGAYFDKLTYERRISISIDTLLIDANARAKSENKMAYVHVVGLGLGVWKIAQAQDQLYMETFHKRINALSRQLTNISDLCFAYIKHPSLGPHENGALISVEGHANGGIRVHMRNRNPHEKLTGDDAGKLLVVSYAWDGNSLPGNEYWHGSLYTSSDPAAACSTQVCELHNAHVNPRNICAANLKIATLKYGVLSFDEYRKRVLQPVSK